MRNYGVKCPICKEYAFVGRVAVTGGKRYFCSRCLKEFGSIDPDGHRQIKVTATPEEMYNLCREGKETCSSLAKKYGVSYSRIITIVNGKYAKLNGLPPILKQRGHNYDMEQLERLVADGKTCGEMAKIIGVKPTTLRSYLGKKRKEGYKV